MKVSYDQRSDAIYIELNDNHPIRTQGINESFFLDFDEFDQVSGIEIIHASKLGIDPLTFVTETQSNATPPTPEEIKTRRAEISAARNRYQARKDAENPS